MPASFQASRLDVCCCKSARELPPPSQDEGLLLRCFRKFYVPFLLHRFTRVVVVSGDGGEAGGASHHPGTGALVVPGAAGSAQP